MPYFRRGYRDQIVAVRRQRGISHTARHESPEAAGADQRESRRSRRDRSSSPSTSRRGTRCGRRSSSSSARTGIRAAADQTTQQYFAILSASFQTAADREWLRQFVRAVEDESRRFYHDYWVSESRAHAAAVARVGLAVAADVAAGAPALPQQHAAAERRAVSLAAARRRGSHGALRQGAERRRGPDAGLAAGGGGGAVRLRPRDRRIGGEYRDRGQHDAGRASRGHVVAVRAVGGGARRRAAAREDDAERGARLHAVLPPGRGPRRADRPQGGVHRRPLPCPTRSTTRSRGSST